MSTPVREIVMTLHGEPASKANSRRKVTNRATGKPMFIKSDKALSYKSMVQQQLALIYNKVKPFEQEHLKFEATIYYASRRPDLDESLILDLLQGHSYLNDRQIKEKHIKWGLDNANPRTEIRITECTS